MPEPPSEKHQRPITPPVAIWIFSMVLGWAVNSVVVKFVTESMPVFLAAFTRFALTVPIIAAFALYKAKGLRLPIKGLVAGALLGALSFTQISLFHWGSLYTTGGRVTLFLFSYPIITPFAAHILVKEERLSSRTVLGAAVAFAGVAIALKSSLGFDPTRLKGDLLEIASAVVLATMIAANKRFLVKFDKWKLLFWQYAVSTAMYAICVPLFETFDYSGVNQSAWLALAFQIVAVGGYCFISYQFVISRHPASKVSVFFLATPLVGMFAGQILREEPFEWTLLGGCFFVAAGIWIANRHSTDNTEKPREEHAGNA
jgi:drug/metabolite transporter (DMT)-like permease